MGKYAHLTKVYNEVNQQQNTRANELKTHLPCIKKEQFAVFFTFYMMYEK